MEFGETGGIDDDPLGSAQLEHSRGEEGDFDHTIGLRLPLDDDRDPERARLVHHLVVSALALLESQARSSIGLENLLAAADRTIDIVLYVQSMAQEETIKLRLGGTQALPPP